jgi:hypothetical protein
MSTVGESSEWRVSSHCDAGSCIEVGYRGERVLVRRSTEPDGAVLDFSRSAWTSFLAGIRAGDFTPR